MALSSCNSKRSEREGLSRLALRYWMRRVSARALRGMHRILVGLEARWTRDARALTALCASIAHPSGRLKKRSDRSRPTTLCDSGPTETG